MAQRRVCSVLFADLVDFTPLSESRDPEEVRELLSQYFEIARTVIGRYGGTVEKFIGDAVMAAWGTPTATEGDAERAVRAALDVVAAVAALGEESGIPDLRARAGVVTGEVAVTVGATGEGMVAGDAVNTAARVQTAAATGAVWVDEATYRLAGAAIGFDDAGTHALKGKAEPARLWSATRVLSGVGGSQRVDGLEAPMLGRDAELRTIRELFHASAERRTPRLVVVSGPAGVGKSRLGWEFEKYVDGLAEVMWWHRGRCLSYGEGVAFWALAEIVRQRFGIAEEDPLDIAAHKLAEGLTTLLPDASEHGYIGLRLARLLGVPFDEDPGTALSTEELFAGWRLFFERLADQGPVVLLLEDAHYADAGLLEFVDHVIDWAREVAIFVLVFARPELEQARPGFGVGRNRTTLTVDPLDSASMRRLLDAFVPGMPADAVSAISGQSQGIPLFAVETVRSLIDRDIVVPREGVYRLVGDIGALSVPDSLHALLAARLDVLSPDLRELLADAAVLGTTFPADALIAVSALAEHQVRDGLADLLRREIFEVSADKLSPQRGSYRFAQDMLRQVAYDTMSRRDRKRRHLEVAAHLRATFPADGDEVSDVVAQHYLDALSAVPDDPDTAVVRAQAIAAVVRAAERALRSGAPRAAATSFTAAAGLTEQNKLADDEAKAARLWENAADADLTAADLAAAVTHAERAALLYANQGLPRAAARAQSTAGRALRRAGRHSEARDLLTAALDVLRSEPDADTVNALSSLAALETFAGGPDADRLTAEALALGQALDVDRGLLADLFIGRGIAHGAADRALEAVCYQEFAARLAEAAGDSSRWGRALLNLSDALGADDPAAAVRAARAARDQGRRIGDNTTLIFAVTNLAAALLLTGDWDEAEETLREAVESDGVEDDQVRLYAAMVAALRGDVDHAIDLAAAPRLRASEDPQDRANVLTTDAFLAAARNDHDETLRAAREAVRQASALGIRSEFVRWSWPLAARTAHTVGDAAVVKDLLDVLDAHPIGHLPPLLRAERDLTRARLSAAQAESTAAEAFSRAVGALRKVASPYHLAHALLDEAGNCVRMGNPGAAERLVEEARVIAQRLRAQPLLDRTGRFTAATSPSLASSSEPVSR